MRGDRAAISDADGHTGGGEGIPRALMRNLRSRDCPVRSLRHSLRQQGADAYTRGTDGSNPSPSTGESVANLTSSLPDSISIRGTTGIALFLAALARISRPSTW